MISITNKIYYFYNRKNWYALNSVYGFIENLCFEMERQFIQNDFFNWAVINHQHPKVISKIDKIFRYEYRYGPYLKLYSYTHIYLYKYLRLPYGRVERLIVIYCNCVQMDCGWMQLFSDRPLHVPRTSP